LQASLPPDEAERLKALRRYEILDTDPEQDYDDMTLLASHLCGTPIAMISLVDENRQWFKSKVGMTASETSRDIAFCAHGILQAEVFVVNDARADKRFASNPLVTGETKIRFYAGARLITSDGHALGMLCVNDQVPRELSLEQKTALQALSRQVVALLELRRSGTELRQTVVQLERTQEQLDWKTALFEAQVNSSIDGILVVDQERKTILQNSRFIDLFKMPPHIADKGEDKNRLRWIADMIKDSESFLQKVLHLYAHPNETSYDEIELKDGTTLDRYSSPAIGKDGKYYGRIWTFRDITARKQAEAELEKTHKQLLAASRRGGMAEIASNVLHNVGNVLNSVNVSTSLIVERVKKSKTSGLAKVVDLLGQHAHDIGEFITHDSKGKHIPVHLGHLSKSLMADQGTIVSELESLRRNVEHIKEIVAMQQNYASVGGVKEMINVVDLVEDGICINEGGMQRHGVEVVRDFEKVPPMNAEKHKILQILVNLLSNAKYACEQSERADKRLTVRVANGEGRVRISVMDNGIGIAPENITRIFNHGFTTRKDGHGFGLHSGALAAKEMGGSLTAQSDGPSQGATFTLELSCPKRENADE